MVSGYSGREGRTNAGERWLISISEVTVLRIDCGQHPEGNEANEGAETPTNKVMESLHPEIQRIKSVGTGRVVLCGGYLATIREVWR